MSDNQTHDHGIDPVVANFKRDQLREEIAQDVEKFLAKGGQIYKAQVHETGLPTPGTLTREESIARIKKFKV